NRHEHGARHRHFLGVASSREQEKDALARAFHLARSLEAQDLRGAGRRRVLALGLEQVGPVHGRRADADEDFVRSRDGIGSLTVNERFGTAGFWDEDGFHGRKNENTGNSLRKERREPGISSKVNRGI